jgi:ribosome-binding protein aMBF1 (putative translation factor)
MSDTRRIAAQLDPRTSARLFEAVEHKRRAYGWTRKQLAAKAKASLSQVVLDTWAYKVRRDEVLRIDLDKALALLAAFGHAENRVDELWWQLSEGVAGLVEQLVDATKQKPAGEPC